MFFLPQPFSQFMVRRRTRELGSLVRNDTDLISPFFLKVWTVIMGLTITDSSSLRLRKLVYSRKQSVMFAIGMSNYPIEPLNLLSLHPYPTTHTPLKISCLLEFHPKFNILIYYSYPSPPICLKIISS